MTLSVDVINKPPKSLNSSNVATMDDTEENVEGYEYTHQNMLNSEEVKTCSKNGTDDTAVCTDRKRTAVYVDSQKMVLKVG